MKVYTVKKAKTDKQNKRHYQQVGTLVLREDGSGVLYLNWLDGEFAIFAKDEKGAAKGERPSSREAAA